MERMSLDVNKMTKDQLRQHILMLAMQLTQLEEENKKLKEESYNELQRLGLENYELREENKKLKEENEYRKTIADVVPEGEGHIAEETIQDLQARIKELNEELRKYKKLHKYSNGELLTYSGD